MIYHNIRYCNILDYKIRSYLGAYITRSLQTSGAALSYREDAVCRAPDFELKVLLEACFRHCLDGFGSRTYEECFRFVPEH